MTLVLGRMHDDETLEFTVPADASRYSQALMAVTGLGKSNAAVVFGEEMYAQGIPWVAIDPKGDWHGIRYSATEGEPGLPIPVFGGLYGNSPLRPEMGARMAELVVKNNMTCVLDVSEFDSKNEMLRFVNDFVKTLFRLHAKHRTVRHVFLEECDEYMPQKVVGGEGAGGKNVAVYCLATCQKLVKQGRGRGLGCTMISQRPAVVNKDALTQIQTMFVLGMTSPQDRKQIREWVDFHVGSKGIVDSLPLLEPGEAWVLSPRVLRMIERVTFRRRWTLDTGSTPELGEEAATVGTMATIDMAEIESALADVIEQAEAVDPARLSRRIRELEQQLQKGPAAPPPAPAPDPEIHYVMAPEVFDAAATFARGHDDLGKVSVELRAAIDALDEAIAVAEAHRSSFFDLVKALPVHELTTVSSPSGSGWKAPTPPASHQVQSGETTRRAQAPRGTADRRPVARSATDVTKQSEGLEGVSDGGRRVLTILYRNPFGLPARRLAALSGYSPRKSTWRSVLARLRAQSLITPGGVDPIVITDAGRELIEPHLVELPTGPELLEWWCNELGEAKGAVLRILVKAYPDVLSNVEAAEAAGYDPSRSTWRAVLAPMRAQGLIEGLRPSDDFMEAIAS